jgi:hypothetical protein
MQQVLEGVRVRLDNGIIRSKAASAAKALCQFLYCETPSGAPRKPNRVTTYRQGYMPYSGRMVVRQSMVVTAAPVYRRPLDALKQPGMRRIP